MRKKDREISDGNEIESILHRAIVCRIGLAESDNPYIVPVNFGYRDGCLYIHSAKEGRKIDILRLNNRVCFEVDIDHDLVRAESACKWGMRYRSVIGFGRAFFVDDFEEKRRALDIIMQHYSRDSYEYGESLVEKAAIIKVEIDSMTGKRSGY